MSLSTINELLFRTISRTVRIKSALFDSHNSVPVIDEQESRRRSEYFLVGEKTMFPSHRSIEKIPLSRVELHVHLDGSLRAETIWELAKQKQVPLPGNGTLTDLKKALVIRDPIDLHHFLQPFLIFTPCVLGDLDAIERVAWEFCEDKARNGVLYCEARYSPHLWLSKDDYIGRLDDLGEVVKAVTRGFRRGKEDFKIEVQSILCTINGLGTASDVLKLCQMFQGEGVVGMDMAGNCMSEEVPYVEVPLTPQEMQAFEEARKSGIHRTVHAGESGGPEMVQRALSEYFAERIGHGYHVLKDTDIYQHVRRDDIHLETCPYSSLLTGSVPLSTTKHPIVQFAEDDINFSISTDDPTVTGFELQDDYDLVQEWGLNEVHLIRANLNAARSCFLPQQEKDSLIKHLETLIGIN